MTRHDVGLLPADEDARQALARIEADANVLVRIVKPRSPDQHRLFFAVIKHVADAAGFDSPEQLLARVKVALGRYDTIKLGNRLVVAPQSISFDAMDGKQFTEFMDQAVAMICRDVLPGMNPADLIDEVKQSIGLREPERAE